MRTVNRIELIGNVGDHMHMGKTDTGAPVFSFMVVTNDRWYKPDGTPMDSSQRHRVAAFGKTAEFIGDRLESGDLVFIEGSMRYTPRHEGGVISEVRIDKFINLTLAAAPGTRQDEKYEVES
jgi:single stranded DNA-binding protein